MILINRKSDNQLRAPVQCSRLLLQRLSIVVALGLMMTTSAAAETVLIKGGKVMTLGEAGTLARADILVRDDRIVNVAADLSDSPVDRTIDASGKLVTPGLWAPITELGLIEIGAAASTNDAAVMDEHIGAAFDPVPAFNPRSTLIPFNRAGGITRAIVMPASEDKIFAGKGFAINLSGSFDSVVKPSLAQRIYLGEYGAELAGGSRANAYAQVKAALTQAREYADNKAAIRRGDWRTLDYSLEDLAALQPIISGEQPVLIRADRASDILQVLELADTFRLNVIIEGAAEGWMVAEQLAAAGVPVVLDPLRNSPDAFERLGARLENPALLQKAGVTILIGSPGYAGTHNSYLSRQGAGNAVAYGLPYDEALKAVSVNIARAFGFDGGVIAPGAVADIVIWSGDPLEVTSHPEVVLIDGATQSLVTRSTRLRDRYLHPKPGHEHGYSY
ncbi:amidohydrolase family protein [Microbulbifer sp.]|uniref:amidohydrolase family protein n=1 Tax=Microbulbifer sp. TaxID=1908541 RepID=UPI0025894B6C|nr:amidohydrolase family protein [Microbulbifer sp.]